MPLLAFSCPSKVKEKGREIPDMGHKKPDVAPDAGVSSVGTLLCI